MKNSCQIFSYPIFMKFSALTAEISIISSDNYTPNNKVVGGYTGFTMSVRLSVDKSYVVR